MEMQLLSSFKLGGQALYREKLESNIKKYLAIQKHKN